MGISATARPPRLVRNVTLTPWDNPHGNPEVSGAPLRGEGTETE